MGAAQQFRALLAKNFILYKRNVGSTVVSLLVPVLFVALLFLMQLAVQSNQSRGSANRVVRDPEEWPIAAIPRCSVGPYGSCYTLGYTSNADPNIVALIDEIARMNNIPPEEIIGFKTEPEANRFLADNRNSTQGLYHIIIDYGCSSLVTPALIEQCSGANHLETEIRSIKFAIQYNTTGFGVRGVSVNMDTYLILPMQHALHQAALRLFGQVPNLNMSVVDFPRPAISPTNIVSSAGPFIIFGALMFNFVIQIGQLVTEKATKLRESMRVMGLADWIFWATWFVTNATTNLISIVLLIVTGLAFQFDFFLKNDFGTYAVLFLLFAFAMVPLAFFVSTLVDDADTSTLAGFAIFLFGVFMQFFASFIFTEDVNVGLHVLFSLFPFVLLAKGLADLGDETASELDNGLRMSEVSDAKLHFFPLSNVYGLLVMNFFLYLLLAIYVDNVRYIGRPPYYFLLPSYWCGSSKKSKKPKKSDGKDEYEVEMDQIDEDVQAERDFVKQGNFDDSVPVIISNLQKTYYNYTCGCCADKGSAFRAVKGIDLVMKQGELFCLLGHNGAGKTTTIGMLTGLFPPSSGDATLFGHSITTEMNEIRKVMGVCPQHDILWKQLSGEEHLLLFANIRGIPEDKLKKEVRDRLEDVDLISAKDNPAGGYSGGMQRRLSVAIALIGDPKIVFLDEPTTGMDPVSRRKVWNLIEKVKRGRVTLLTTHSMEEADILGDKIAIMKDGRLATIGTSIRLKNRFGTGYDIAILGNSPADVPAIKQFVLDQFKSATPLNIDDEDAKAKLGVFQFEVPRSEGKRLPGFFRTLEKNLNKIGAKDFQVALSTLEEVFLRIAHIDDVKEKKREKKKSNKCLIASLIVVAIIVVLLIFGLVIAFLPRPVIPEKTAADLGPEPLSSAVPVSSIDLDAFPSGIQVSEVRDTSASIVVRVDASLSQIDLTFYRVDPSTNTTWMVDTTLAGYKALPTIAVNNDTALVAVHVTGLTAGTTYSVVATDTADSTSHSNATRFRTPFSGTARKFKIGVSSGFGFTNRPYENLVQAASYNLDFFVLLGNSIYANFNGSESDTPDVLASRYDDTLQTEGFRALSSSTSFYAQIGKQEMYFPVDVLANPANLGNLGVYVMNAMGAFKTTWGIGLDNSTKMYRKFSWGDAIDLFVIDIRTEITPFSSMMTREQMDWLKNGLLNSQARFKLIAQTMPISNIAEIDQSTFQTLIPELWATYAANRTELLQFIDDSEINGVVFLSGGIDYGLFRVNVTKLNSTATNKNNAFEVVSGPSGSLINPNIRLSSALSSAPADYLILLDSWTWTLIEGDPVSGDLTFKFINDRGQALRTQSVDVDDYQLDIEQYSAQANFFR